MELKEKSYLNRKNTDLKVFFLLHAKKSLTRDMRFFPLSARFGGRRRQEILFALPFFPPGISRAHFLFPASFVVLRKIFQGKLRRRRRRGLRVTQGRREDDEGGGGREEEEEAVNYAYFFSSSPPDSFSSSPREIIIFPHILYIFFSRKKAHFGKPL